MSTLIIRDLPEDRTLDGEAMQKLRGGLSFTSRVTASEPIRIFPTDPIRIFIPGDPIHPAGTNVGYLS